MILNHTQHSQLIHKKQTKKQNVHNKILMLIKVMFYKYMVSNYHLLIKYKKITCNTITDFIIFK